MFSKLLANPNKQFSFLQTRKMFETKSNHVCTIEEKSSDSRLPIVSPLASNLTKMKRFFKKLILVAEGNPASISFYRNPSRIVEERKAQVASGSWVIHPFSMFRLYYEMWMTVIFLICLFHMPLHAAYEVLRETEMDTLHTALSIVCLFDIVMNFLTGQCISTENIVMSPRKIAKRYIFGIYFITDLVSSLPNLRLIVGPAAAKWLSYCLALKIVRIVTFFIYMERTSTYFNVKGFAFLVIKIFLLFVMLLHYFTCVQFLFERAFHYVTGKKKMRDDSLFHLYVIHTYSSASLLLAVDIDTNLDRPPISFVLTIMLYIVGKVVISFLIVMILDMMKISNLLEEKYYQMMSQINSYMTTQEFPKALQKRMRIFYLHKYRQKYINENKIEKYISEKLKKEIKYHECRKLVHSVKIFESLPTKIIEDIVPYLKKEIYLAGDEIVKAGNPGDCMYFLESGTVAVTSPSGKEICHLQDGDYFGELCVMIPKLKRTATVIALEVCELYRLEKKHFKRCVESHPDVYGFIQQEAKKRFLQTKAIESSFVRHASGGEL